MKPLINGCFYAIAQGSGRTRQPEIDPYNPVKASKPSGGWDPAMITR